MASSNEKMNPPEEVDMSNLTIDEEWVEVDEEELMRMLEDEPDNANEQGEEEEARELETLYPNARRISSTVTFEHKKSVFAANFDVSGTFVATASQDDIGSVWKSDGEKVFDCTGHEESVIEAKFNFDGTYVATADLNGTVKIWKMATKTLHDEYNIGDEILWINWHSTANILFAGTEGGDTYMWRLPMTKFKILYGRGACCECSEILPDGKTIVAGYRDGSVVTFDLKSAKELHTYKHATNSPVTCLDVNGDKNLIAAGYSDGSIVLIKITNGSVVGTLKRLESPTLKVRSLSTTQAPASTPMESGELSDTIETASDDEAADDSTYIQSIKFGVGVAENILAEGGHDMIHLWDFARKTLRKSVELNCEAVSRMVWHKAGVLFVAGILRNNIYGIDGRTGNFIVLISEHNDAVLNISLSPDHSVLLTASDDGTARVFPLDNLEKLVRDIAQNEITSRDQ